MAKTMLISRAAGLFTRVLAHDRGTDGVVAADADPKNEAEEDQPPDAGRQGGGNGAGGEDQDLIAIDALAAQHVGDAAEQKGADG
jgi:hypothetical protein